MRVAMAERVARPDRTDFYLAKLTVTGSTEQGRHPGSSSGALSMTCTRGPSRCRSTVRRQNPEYGDLRDRPDPFLGATNTADRKPWRTTAP